MSDECAVQPVPCCVVLCCVVDAVAVQIIAIVSTNSASPPKGVPTLSMQLRFHSA
ncbi:hypothetical protein BC832DRAFT_545107 [Gaertneriomyces semiglobifer]|nr:hypothetical protein BC832DRAFT_545107 [Gaertneriomyces semiglobifer]